MSAPNNPLIGRFPGGTYENVAGVLSTVLEAEPRTLLDKRAHRVLIEACRDALVFEQAVVGLDLDRDEELS